MSQENVVTENTVNASVISGAAVVDSSVISSKLKTTLEINNADQRQNEIVFNHALAQSSNVTTPQDDIPDNSSPFKSPIVETEVEPKMIAKNENELKPQFNVNINEIQESTTIPTTVETKPSVPKKTIPKTYEVINVEDDFFSMYTPKSYYTVEKKKKKKKKNISKISSTTVPTKHSTIDSPINLSSSAISSPEPKAPNDDSIIIIDDDDEVDKNKEIVQPPTKKKKLRALTPPPIDEIKFKKNFMKERALDQDIRRKAEQLMDYDKGFYNDDDLDSRLEALDRITKSVVNETKGRHSSVDGTASNESISRDYSLKVTSYLPGSTDNVIDLNVKGTKRISTIIKTILKYFIDSGIVPNEFLAIYKPENIVLLWKDVKLVGFMKIDSLKIPIPLSGKPASVELHMYTNVQADSLKEIKKLREKVKLADLAKDEQVDSMLRTQIQTTDVFDPFKDDQEFKEIDEETNERESSKEAEINDKEESKQPEEEVAEEDGYFTIGLLGSDHDKIIVKVNSETKLLNLVNHYIKKKNLPKKSKVKLSFDNEDLDLSNTIGDTELEDEDTLEVHVK